MFLKRIFKSAISVQRRSGSDDSSSEDDEDKDLHQVSQGSFDNIATYEVALKKAKFGCFNVRLFLGYLPCMLLYFIQITGISYLAPILGCDIILNKHKKAVLVASGYFGAAFASLLWSLISSTYRRKYFIIGFAGLHVCFKIGSAMYQNYYMLLCFELAAGFVAGFPYFIYGNEMLEYHYGKYRRNLFVINLLMQTILHALISGGVWLLFRNYDNVLFQVGSRFNFKKTNVYLALCSIPGVIVMIARLFFNETPKHYMTIGDEHKALEIIQNIYEVNTGKDKDTYPFTRIVKEPRYSKSHGQVVVVHGIRRACKKCCNFFMLLKDDGGILAFLCLLKAIVMASLHGFKNWMPSVFAHINTHYVKNNYSYTNMCSLVRSDLNVTLDEDRIYHCSEHLEIDRAYFHMFMLMCMLLLTNVLYIVSIFTTQRRAVITLFTLLSTLCGVAILFTEDARVFLIVAGILLSLMTIVQVTVFELITSIYSLYNPTLTLCFAMACGRMGVVIGIIIFGATSYICHGSIIFIIVCTGSVFLVSFFMPDEGGLADSEIF